MAATGWDRLAWVCGKAIAMLRKSGIDGAAKIVIVIRHDESGSQYVCGEVTDGVPDFLRRAAARYEDQASVRGKHAVDVATEQLVEMPKG